MSSPSNWYYDRSYVLEHVCLSALSASLVMSCQHSTDCACGYNSLTHAHTHNNLELLINVACNLHILLGFHRLFYSFVRTKAEIQMSHECFYQGGLNNKCLALYVGEQQASLTLTCLSTSTATTTTRAQPKRVLCKPLDDPIVVVRKSRRCGCKGAHTKESAVQKICFVL